LRPKTVGRSKLQFYHREHIKRASLTIVESRNGTVPVSDRETTMLDIANDIRIVGGINNSANLIIELCEAVEPDIEAIIKIAVQYPITTVRRLGFLLERFTNTSGLDTLAEYCKKRKTAMSILDPQAQLAGSINTRWNIKLNREVSPDV
jgi:predicted transcriptional regulator of viral defense system